MQDSQEYLDRKAFFASLITVYGRNVVMEMLDEENVDVVKIHMSESNKQEGVIKKIIAIAETRNIELVWHDNKSLSRISKNAKQDQGIAADIKAKNYVDAISYLKNRHDGYRFIALDGVQNPQNLGMIIRSVAAGYIDGILLPSQNSAKISPLVIKGSAGTLFKTTILYCDTLNQSLKAFKEDGAQVYSLSLDAKTSLFDATLPEKCVFVLGNESDGVSPGIGALCNNALHIPMNNGVESLNVAVTAALLAFYSA